MKPALLEIPVSGRIKTTPERTQLSICERRSGQIIQNKPCAFPALRITCETEHHGNTARGHVGDSLCLNPISTSPEIIRILIQSPCTTSQDSQASDSKAAYSVSGFEEH